MDLSSTEWHYFKTLIIGLKQSGLLPFGPVFSLGRILQENTDAPPEIILKIWSIEQTLLLSHGGSLLEIFQKDLLKIFSDLQQEVPGELTFPSTFCNQLAKPVASPGPTLFNVDETLCLTPLATPGPILPLDKLLGQEEARSRLVPALCNFLQGRPPQHSLLYGPRGTGKSTAILSLLDLKEAAGLRVVEVKLNQIHLLQDLALYLSRLPGKFAIYLDDLSFQMSDPRWIQLKTALEGSLSRPFDRVWLIATSNKKDLVFRPEDLKSSLQGKELLQALRALDDRFILKVPFFKLNQDQIQSAIHLHLGARPLPFPEEELLPRFYRFCMENNLDEPSGRSARDFARQFEVD